MEDRRSRRERTRDDDVDQEHHGLKTPDTVGPRSCREKSDAGPSGAQQENGMRQFKKPRFGEIREGQLLSYHSFIVT